MVLLPALVSAKKALGCAMGGSPSSKDDPSLVRLDGDPYQLPHLKSKSGEEPRTSRLKSLGFQDGKWVIARPKLATPTIYQHSRGPSGTRGGIHGHLGLGEGTRESRGTSNKRASTQSARMRSGWVNWEAIGTDGEVQPRGQDNNGGDNVEIVQQVLEDKEGQQEEEEENLSLPIVDIPALDDIQSLVEDLYYATAHPRFAVGSTRLRRQHQSASSAASALTNAMGEINRRTNQSSKSTDKVGDERTELLEFVARVMIRRLREGLPASMATKAAAALQKAATFQDVRARLADCSPSAVMPLVDLLPREASDKDSRGKSKGQEMYLKDEKVNRRANEAVGMMLAPPQHLETERSIALNAAECLRTLSLSEGLPEKMLSSFAIPPLVDGLKYGSTLMKSVCGGCLSSMAQVEEVACLEMLDFGIMLPLLEMTRSTSLVDQLTAWALLAEIVRVPEARRAFARAKGSDDLEAIILREPNEEVSKHATSRFLPSCQENALRVLEKLCEGGWKEDQRGEDGGLLPRISWSFLSNSTDDGGREAAAGASFPTTLQFSEAQEGVRGETWCTDGGVHHFNSGEFVSREGVFKAIMGHMNTGTHVAAAAAAKVLIHARTACSREQVDATIPAVVGMLASSVWVLKHAAFRVILHAYVQDEHRLAFVKAGGLVAIIDTLRMKVQQGDALAALLSLCEHPDVPGLLVKERGLAIVAEYLTTARDVATRYMALTIMKIVLVCERPAAKPFLPDMVVSELVLGANEEVEAFVGAFVKKRKAFTDYLRLGEDNLRRFSPTDIAAYKEMFKEGDKDGRSVLNERELKRILKQLKVDCTKESVRKVVTTARKNSSGGIQFDEFLDIVWNVRRVKRSRRTAVLRTAGIFIGTAFSALRGRRS